MSTARVTLKFGKIPFEAFFAGAANVIFRHASTGVWVKEVREYASTRVREDVREYAREKSWWTLFGLTTKAGNGMFKFLNFSCKWSEIQRGRI